MEAPGHVGCWVQGALQVLGEEVTDKVGQFGDLTLVDRFVPTGWGSLKKFGVSLLFIQKMFMEPPLCAPLRWAVDPSAPATGKRVLSTC